MNKLAVFSLIAIITFFTLSCKKKVIENAVQFEFSEYILPASEDTLIVKILADRKANENSPVKLSYELFNLENETNLIIEPAPAFGSIFLTIAEDSDQTSVKIIKSGKTDGPDRTVTLSINKVNEPVIKGKNESTVIKFE